MTAQECIDIPNDENSMGYKGFLFLAIDLSLVSGGDSAILRINQNDHDQVYWDQNSQTLQASRFVLPSGSSPDSWQCVAGQSENLDIHINGCLAFEGVNEWPLYYNPAIGIIVIGVTLVKAIAMLCAARLHRHKSPPILTVGDAIASFITKPDVTTQGKCWASIDHVERSDWGCPSVNKETQQSFLQYQQLFPPQRLGNACGRSSWLCLILLYVPKPQPVEPFTPQVHYPS